MFTFFVGHVNIIDMLFGLISAIIANIILIKLQSAENKGFSLKLGKNNLATSKLTQIYEF